MLGGGPGARTPPAVCADMGQLSLGGWDHAGPIHEGAWCSVSAPIPATLSKAVSFSRPQSMDRSVK